MRNFYDNQVDRSGLPRQGFAVVYFPHMKDSDYYDLSAGFSRVEFERWLFKEFGYLKYTVTYS